MPPSNFLTWAYIEGMVEHVEDSEIDWPIFGLRIEIDAILLRHVRETDLPTLAAVQPDDYEHDPGPESFVGVNLAEHRRRLCYQGYWQSVGNWSPQSWSMHFLVESGGQFLGVQSLEADRFATLRTVDSGSWLMNAARGQGIGKMMRRAVLGLAFDHLGARVAVTSARQNNTASLTISRQLGYRDNGVSLTENGSGVTELQHLRLTAPEWGSSKFGRGVEVSGLEACRTSFGLW